MLSLIFEIFLIEFTSMDAEAPASTGVKVAIFSIDTAKQENLLEKLQLFSNYKRLPGIPPSILEVTSMTLFKSTVRDASPKKLISGLLR
jgi:hypothetical protein